MTGPLPVEQILRCPSPDCGAPAHRLDLMGATHVRCLDCKREWARAQVLQVARSERERIEYETDYEAIAHPSLWWQTIYGPLMGEMPGDPLLLIEALVDWHARGRTRRRDCGSCLRWAPEQGAATRPRGKHRPDPGPTGSCAGCALSYLDAVDSRGREVEEIPATHLTFGTRAYYISLRDLPAPDEPAIVLELGKQKRPTVVYTRLEFYLPGTPSYRQLLGMDQPEMMATTRTAQRPPATPPSTRTAVFDRGGFSSQRGGRRYYREWNAGGWVETAGRKPYVLEAI